MTAQIVGGEQPQENQGLQYEDICKIVGNLYLDSFHVKQGVESQFKTVVESLKTQITTLINDNAELEKELVKFEESEDVDKIGTE